jgi:hypothetical protein
MTHPSVQPNHSFFWDTKLSLERMKEISDWIGSLSKEDKSKLDDLIADVKDEEWWNGVDAIKDYPSME